MYRYVLILSSLFSPSRLLLSVEYYADLYLCDALLSESLISLYGGAPVFRMQILYTVISYEYQNMIRISYYDANIIIYSDTHIIKPINYIPPSLPLRFGNASWSRIMMRLWKLVDLHPTSIRVKRYTMLRCPIVTYHTTYQWDRRGYPNVTYQL